MSAAICSVSTRNWVRSQDATVKVGRADGELRRRLARLFELPGLLLDHHDVGQAEARLRA